MTNQLVGGGNRRHARAFVDQGDLAEIVPRLQGRVSPAANKNRCFTESIRKKVSPPRPP